MKKNLIIAFISICLLTSLDQFVKYIINIKMKLGDTIEVFDGVFSITYVQNRGAAWGNFSGKRLFLLILTILILICAIYVYLKLLKLNEMKLLRICLVFLISGALGNIIDRILHGYVIDMFDFCLINFPVFNVADIFITCSVILIVILLLFKYKDEDFDKIIKKIDKAGK